MSRPKYATTPRKRISFIIDMGSGDDEESEHLLENLDEYCKLLGWSRKRFYLLGASMIISENKDNPELVMQIAEYLAGRR